MMTPVSPAANRLPSLDSQSSAPARKSAKPASAPAPGDDFAAQVSAVVSLGQQSPAQAIAPMGSYTGEGAKNPDPQAPGSDNPQAGPLGAAAGAMKIPTASALVNPSGVSTAEAAAGGKAAKPVSPDEMRVASGAGQSVRSVSSLEQLPSTQLGATQAKLGGQIMGGQPWDSSWVFAGDQQPGLPQGMKPLIGGAPQDANGLSADVMSKLPPELLARLSALQGGADSLAGVMGEGMESEAAGGLAVAGGLKGASGKPASPMAGQLGGADFLSMIAAGRAPMAPSTPGMGTGAGAGEQGGQFGQDASQSGLQSGDAISGGKLKRTSFEDEFAGAGAMAGAQTMGRSLAGGKATKLEVTGNVTSGAMAQDRLSSESLTGISSSIKSLGQNGLGEMRVRLKPDNLGELNLKVMTQGNQVSIQIQASDDRAKKIIEESLGHLRDSLSTQNLSLGRVDVAVASQQSQSLGNDFNQNPQSPAQAFDLLNGQAQNQGQNQGSRPGLWDAETGRMSTAASRAASAAAGSAATVAQAARRYTEAGNSRIDVTA